MRKASENLDVMMSDVYLACLGLRYLELNCYDKEKLKKEKQRIIDSIKDPNVSKSVEQILIMLDVEYQGVLDLFDKLIELCEEADEARNTSKNKNLDKKPNGKEGEKNRRERCCKYLDKFISEYTGVQILAFVVRLLTLFAILDSGRK